MENALAICQGVFFVRYFLKCKVQNFSLFSYTDSLFTHLAPYPSTGFSAFCGITTLPKTALRRSQGRAQRRASGCATSVSYRLSPGCGFHV